MTTKRRLPLWVSNLLVFGVLIVVVVVYFIWQIRQARTVFFDQVHENAQLVAEVIQLNAQGAVLSQKVTEEILESFLGNTARFVEYLDSLEPFTQQELSAFVAEKALEGIRIIREEGDEVSGPARWLAGYSPDCSWPAHLEYQPEEHRYLLVWPLQEGDGCILIGLGAANIELLQQQLGLPHLTKTISKLPGICYVNLDKMGPQSAAVQGVDQEVCLQVTSGFPVAEVRLYADDFEISVGMCTDSLAATLQQIWRDFVIFSVSLAFLGGLLSLVLYRLQSAYLRRVRSYERQLALEREDGALGRAAASIAHEIRNPLNALKMGLQRLQIEGTAITPEHQHLVGLMLDAVRRANGAVGGLLNYARPQTPRKQIVQLNDIVQNILKLYENQCLRQQIEVRQAKCPQDAVSVDPDLMHQALENLIKNAIEAQPDGGFIEIDLHRKAAEMIVTVRNGGFKLQPDDTDKMLEPYFTTKTDGFGLGLSIVRRILDAHNGRVKVLPGKEPETVEIRLYVPQG